MSVDEWGPLEWLLLALSTVVAVALPPAIRLKLATPTLPRERVLYSRPRAVVVQTVMLCVGACAVGIPLGLGVERFPSCGARCCVAALVVGYFSVLRAVLHSAADR